jgi:cbb3-type cytochrome oxidase subunit 3
MVIYLLWKGPLKMIYLLVPLIAFAVIAFVYVRRKKNAGKAAYTPLILPDAPAPAAVAIENAPKRRRRPTT